MVFDSKIYHNATRIPDETVHNLHVRYTPPVVFDNKIYHNATRIPDETVHNSNSFSIIMLSLPLAPITKKEIGMICPKVLDD